MMRDIKHIILIIPMIVFSSSIVPTNAQPGYGIGIGAGLTLPVGTDIKTTYDLSYFFSLDSRILRLFNDLTIGPSFIFQRFSNEVGTDVYEELYSYSIGVQFNYYISLDSSNTFSIYPMTALFYGYLTDSFEADKAETYEIFNSVGLTYNLGIGLAYKNIGIEIFYLLNNNKITPSTRIVNELSAQGLIIKESTLSMSTLMMCIKYHFNFWGGQY